MQSMFTEQIEGSELKKDPLFSEPRLRESRSSVPNNHTPRWWMRLNRVRLGLQPVATISSVRHMLFLFIGQPYNDGLLEIQKNIKVIVVDSR